MLMSFCFCKCQYRKSPHARFVPKKVIFSFDNSFRGADITSEGWFPPVIVTRFSYGWKIPGALASGIFLAV